MLYQQEVSFQSDLTKIIALEIDLKIAIFKVLAGYSDLLRYNLGS